MKSIPKSYSIHISETGLMHNLTIWRAAFWPKAAPKYAFESSVVRGMKFYEVKSLILIRIFVLWEVCLRLHVQLYMFFKAKPGPKCCIQCWERFHLNANTQCCTWGWTLCGELPLCLLGTPFLFRDEAVLLDPICLICACSWRALAIVARAMWST